MVKANATGPRRGSVFINPGGPGGSGIVTVNVFRESLLNRTGGVYDIIGFDPRGVGLTTPGEVFCFDTLEEYISFFNGTVEMTGMEYTGNFTDPADISRVLSQAPLMQEKYEEVGKKCLDSPSGKYLKYLGTAAVVRDIISMADTLDGPGAPVNYMGFSYGTLLGAWLINMFPERVGRVIVDGVLNPIFFATEQLPTHWAPQLASSDMSYKGFITGCALSGPSGCSIASEGDTVSDIDVKVQQLLQVAHDATVKNTSVLVSSGNFRAAMYTAMYEPQTWANFSNTDWPTIVQKVWQESTQQVSMSWREAIKQLTHGLVKREANETRPYSIVAIFCGDSVDPDGTNTTQIFESVIAGTQNSAHMFGGTWPNLASQCPLWPVRTDERYQGPFNKTLANKILIASTTYDPITPLAGAQALAAALGDSAALVRVNGFGHTTTFEPSACLTDITAAYMVNGTLPANNTVCEVDSDFQVFNGVTVPDIVQALSNPTTTA